MQAIAHKGAKHLKTIVIKCGGSVLEELTDDFFNSLKELMESGYDPVIVHGGGPAINHMLDQNQIPAHFINGLRVTCEDTMKIVEMVLSGQTNRQLCGMLGKRGFNALGINGSDASFLQAAYIDQEKLGYVGTITNVNTDLIMMLIGQGYIPVITPIAASADGCILNINGDYAAASIAKAINAERCAFVTNVEGILIDGQLKNEVTDQEINRYIAEGSIYGGMIPKVKSALYAVGAGVQSAMIISGMKEFYKNCSWHGTVIAAEERMLK